MKNIFRQAHFQPLDLKDCLKGLFEARHIATVKVVEVKGDEVDDVKLMYYLCVHILSLSLEDVPVGLIKMRTDHVRLVLRTLMAMDVHYQKHECTYHLFHQVYAGSNESVDMLTGLLNLEETGERAL